MSPEKQMIIFGILGVIFTFISAYELALENFVCYWISLVVFVVTFILYVNGSIKVVKKYRKGGNTGDSQ